MNILIVLTNIAAIAVIFIIFVYCWLDKRRFYIERQFRAAEDLFDEWMEHAAALPVCKEATDAYKNTRNISAKYRAIHSASMQAWGKETPQMEFIAGELSVFFGVYNVLAEEYNRRLNSKFTGRIAAFLGFKKFPNIILETEHVQN